MPSKLVLTRQRSCNAVIESVKTNAPLIGASLDALFKPVNDQQAIASHEALLCLYSALLSGACAAMITADEADIQEGLDDAEPIRRRDQEAQALYEKVLALRRTTSILGEITTKALGISGEIPRDPLTLSRLVSDISNAAHKINPPEPLIEGVSLDLKTAAASLNVTSAKLDAAIADVARELREGQQALSTKNAAIQHYDNIFAAIVPILENLYRLAGKPDLANKIHPSSRRPGVIAELPEEDIILT
jgi:hypothetical protein